MSSWLLLWLLEHLTIAPVLPLKLEFCSSVNLIDIGSEMLIPKFFSPFLSVKSQVKRRSDDLPDGPQPLRVDIYIKAFPGHCHHFHCVISLYLILCTVPRTWLSECPSFSNVCQLPNLQSMLLWGHISTLYIWKKIYIYILSQSIRKVKYWCFSLVNPVLERVSWKWQLTVPDNFTMLCITKPFGLSVFK